MDSDDCGQHIDAISGMTTWIVLFFEHVHGSMEMRPRCDGRVMSRGWDSGVDPKVEFPLLLNTANTYNIANVFSLSYS